MPDFLYCCCRYTFGEASCKNCTAHANHAKCTHPRLGEMRVAHESFQRERITPLAKAPTSIRGVRADLVILDEAAGL